MTVTILRADALALPLADETVDAIVTSPPYFGLRSYQDGGEHYAGQLGSEATPAEFVDALLAATREMVRVLKPSGSIWVNLGDKYDSSTRSTPQPFLANSDDYRGGRVIERQPVFSRPKSLMGIPWRYALACIDRLGLILRAEIIWSKPNGLPESVTDRVRRSHETWFHMTKSARYYSAVDEIREPSSDYVRLNGAIRLTPGGQRPRAMTDDVNPLGKLPGSVWTVPTEPLTVPSELGVDHFAAFPTEFPRRIIAGWSPSGICQACGEGRRPVVDRTPMQIRHSPRAGGYGSRITDGITGTMLAPAETTITGYVCACTPHTDHPGTRDPVGTVRFGAGAALKDNAERSDEGRYAPREGTAWREYHFDRWTPAPTRPAVVLDPFGGTGTVALVADVLGRHGIHVDLSADYNRLARWRTADPAQRARAARVDKPPPVIDGQLDLLGGLL